MTREHLDQIRLRLLLSGVCPACGSPIDRDSLLQLRLACANPTCSFSYQPALNEKFELAVASDRPSPARLPLRES